MNVSIFYSDTRAEAARPVFEHLDNKEMVDGKVDGAIRDLMQTMWEVETQANTGFVITNCHGHVWAVLTVVKADGPVDGVVEVYFPCLIVTDEMTSLVRFRVTYNLTADGGYDSTTITRL